MSIAERLYANRIRAPETSEGSNEALAMLDSMIQLYFCSGSFSGMKEKAEGWHRQMKTKKNDTLRVGTFDIASLGPQADKPIYIGYDTTNDPRPDDGGGKYGLYENGQQTFQYDRIANRPLVLEANVSIRKKIVDYLKQIIGTELRSEAEMIVDATPEGYRAIVSLDYYSNRPTNTNKLHKDTVGNTLFVALHYLNPEAMLGPEYIYDKWPIPAEKGQEWFDIKTADRRAHAPWQKDSKNQSRTYWPASLLQDLELAREKLVEPVGQLHHVNLNANGMVSFVDELIYHATPFRGQRIEKPSEELFEKIGLGGSSFVPWEAGYPGQTPPKLIRSISLAKIGGETLPSDTGGAETRKFVRLWMSVVPEDWCQILRCPD